MLGGEVVWRENEGEMVEELDEGRREVKGGERRG